jgi:hypothetical protein
MEFKMKNILKIICLLVIVLIVGLSIIACNNSGGGGGGNDGTSGKAKNQSATITGLFDNNASATVKGNLTDAEWAGVADKIKVALNDIFPTSKTMYIDVFNRGVTIIVEKTPVGYTKWKTTTDGKTMYLAHDELDNNLKTSINVAVDKMWDNTAGFAKAIPPVHNSYQKINQQVITWSNNRAKLARVWTQFTPVYFYELTTDNKNIQKINVSSLLLRAG